MNNLLVLLILLLAVSFRVGNLFAQTETEENLDLIEAELSKANPKPEAIKRDSSRTATPEIKNLGDLSYLEDFSNVAVIQKRWMPKTGRVQFYGGLAAMTNDPWFLTAGGIGRIGYGFTEKWGLELSAMGLSSSANSSAKDLETNNGILTTAFVSPKTYFGGHILWTPIYGKVTFLNQRITPFDMYFYLGGGSLSLQNAKSASTTATQLGMGQIFAITRSVGLRWDLSVMNYSADSLEGVGGSFNNILMSVGMSVYVPGVGTR